MGLHDNDPNNDPNKDDNNIDMSQEDQKTKKQQLQKEWIAKSKISAPEYSPALKHQLANLINVTVASEDSLAKVAAAGKFLGSFFVEIDSHINKEVERQVRERLDHLGLSQENESVGQPEVSEAPKPLPVAETPSEITLEVGAGT